MKKIFLTGLFLVLISGSLGALPAEPAGAGNQDLRAVLDRLEENMRHIDNMKTQFVETKKMSLFERDIKLTGSVAMEKPGRFAWRTDSPVRYALVVDQDKISQWDEDSGRVQTVRASASPVMKIVIEQMRTWFYGAYGEMMGQYKVTLVSKEPLTLQFVPEEKSPAFGMISAVTLVFENDQSYIAAIRIDEKNGDYSFLKFNETRLNEGISPEVWKADKNA